MAHCPIAQLTDLSALLDALRALPGIREPKPGIFYRRSQGFLHFHLKQGRRWADVRDGKDWGEPLEIPFEADSACQQAFLAEVSARWSRCL
ncbi:MAG: hypothetical protein CVV27_15385 [Candidatus Melainabacteria bacterium HGW-Melainabacteria-1]|nr:MAG: hypothetical protein CVV27_15385 [Candidatus Melainabacteria bacterium HGW-Melainabacteria-1]